MHKDEEQLANRFLTATKNLAFWSQELLRINREITRPVRKRKDPVHKTGGRNER